MDLMMFERYKSAVPGSVAEARVLNEIVAEEMPLVRGAARRAVRASRSADAAASPDDAVQNGLIGLITALKKWEPEKGPWGPFARRKVQDAVREGLPSESLVHINRGRHKARALLTNEQVREDYAIRARTGRDGTAEELGVPQETLDKWRAPRVKVSSVSVEDDPRCEGSTSPSLDTSVDIMQTLKILDPLEQRVVLSHFVEEKTFEEIGKQENFSDEWARVVCKEAVEKMKNRLAD